MKCYNCEKENIEGSKFCSNCGCTLVMELEYSVLNNRYKVLDIIGAGGMSTVLKAEDQNLGDSICVIKEMSNSFTSQKERIYAVKKFKDEAFILAKMRHPNIPVVTDYFVENDKYYLVMDYIPGKNLKEILKEQSAGYMPEELVKNISIQICGILEYLHGQENPIIHRDLKPSNFLLEENTGRVILIDFGIARRFDKDKTGTLIGTPGYMAPEQYTGKVDIRCDIFSLGATIHHLLTGEDPADRASFDFAPAKDICQNVSLQMESIVSKAVENKPSRRFQSATEFKRALLQKGYIETPGSNQKDIPEAIGLPGLLPTSAELKKRGAIPSHSMAISRVTRKAGDFKDTGESRKTKMDITSRRRRSRDTRKASRAASIPEIDNVINVQLHSFLDKGNIKNIMESYIGIDIGTVNIKMLQMYMDEKYYIYPAKVIVVPAPAGSLEEGVVVEPDRIAGLLTKIIADCNIKAKKVIISIPKKGVEFKSCLIPESESSRLKDIISARAKDLFPFLNEKAFLDYQAIYTYLPRKDGNIEVIMGGVEEKIVNGLRETIEKCNLELANFKLQPFILNKSINLIAGEEAGTKGLIILDIGAEHTSINILKDGYLWFTNTFSFGGNDLTRAIASKVNIDFKKAEALKKKHLRLTLADDSKETEIVISRMAKSMLKNLFNEIMKNMEDFNNKYNISEPFPLLLSGGTALIEGLDSYIEKELDIKCFKFKMPVSKRIDVNRDVAAKIGPSLMVSFSLAMSKLFRGAEKDEIKINLEETKETKKSFWDIFKYKIF